MSQGIELRLSPEIVRALWIKDGDGAGTGVG